MVAKQEIKLSFLQPEVVDTHPEPSLCLWAPCEPAQGSPKASHYNCFFTVHMAFNFLAYSHCCHIPESVLKLTFSPVWSNSWFRPAPVQLLRQLEAAENNFFKMHF